MKQNARICHQHIAAPRQRFVGSLLATAALKTVPHRCCREPATSCACRAAAPGQAAAGAAVSASIPGPAAPRRRCYTRRPPRRTQRRRTGQFPSKFLASATHRSSSSLSDGSPKAYEACLAGGAGAARTACWVCRMQTPLPRRSAQGLMRPAAPHWAEAARTR